MSQLVIVDYGMGNIKSVQRGLEKAGGKPIFTEDPEVIRQADRVVLPGVGAFEDGMGGLRKVGLIEALDDFVATGRPLLGICLGMQMLFDHSEEHGEHQGLGYIPGVVRKIPAEENGRQARKIPHIGWNALHYPGHRSDWKGSLLDNSQVGRFFYFVHSFMVIPDNVTHLLAQCEYEGIFLTAAVVSDNVTGVQFHPEKSGENGLRILEAFLGSRE